MKKVYQNNFILGICLVVCFLIGLVAPVAQVHADDADSVTARIPFSYKDESGECGKAEILIEYVKDMPAPDSDTKTVSSGSTDYFSIDINEAGIYSYKVSQKAGDKSDVKYDDTVYNVTVYVTENHDLDKLEYTVTAVSYDSGAKPDKLEFVNKGKGTSGKTDPEPEPKTDTETKPGTDTGTKPGTETGTNTGTDKLPEKATVTKNGSDTKTGDDAALYTVIAIGAVAFISVIVIVCLKKRKNGDR